MYVARIQSTGYDVLRSSWQSGERVTGDGHYRLHGVSSIDCLTRVRRLTLIIHVLNS